MAIEDLPSSLGSVVGGGVTAFVLLAAAWVANRYRGVANDGEEIADRRIASINGDFDKYRQRTDGEITQLRDRLDEYRDANDTLRRELHQRDQAIREVHQKMLRLEADIRELRGQPPPGMDPPPGGLPHGVG